jgi:hypothetical protein
MGADQLATLTCALCPFEEPKIRLEVMSVRAPLTFYSLGGLLLVEAMALLSYWLS